MNDTRNYPNYIGVETETINSIKLKLKYTGDSEKVVIVSEGSLVSVGHVINENGALTYNITMGIVKRIGMDSIRNINMLNNPNVGISNPYYLVIDRSNTFASDVVNVYIRDIRDIVVGPMGEGPYAKGEQSGISLPLINDANKDMYDGRFFFLIQDCPHPDVEGALYTKGLYYCLDGNWVTVTTSDETYSSPLVASSSESEDPDKHIEYELRGDVFIRGTNITNIPAVNEHEFGDLVCDKMNSDIRFYKNGDLVTYQIHLTGLSLPVDPVPEVPETPSNVSIVYTVDTESYKEAVIKPAYYEVFEREKTIPKQNTPVMISRVLINGSYYNVYHMVNTTGDIVIHYPNIAGITDMDLSGYYLK